MNDSDLEADDVEERLDALLQRCGELLDACHYRSAYHAYGELGRLAKREARAIPYIASVFHQMDLAQYLLEPQRQREHAIELLALLENEEAARRVQPDLPEWQYEHEAGWRTACGYENLAEAAGAIDGFNSEGMHAIIAEGLLVCRRTGKLECVRCFREYATDVYAAADDLEIALHQCKSIMDHPGPWSDRGDRRWLAAAKAAWFLQLNGGIEQSVAMLRNALELANEEGVGVAVEARQRVLVQLASALVLLGHDDVKESRLPPHNAANASLSEIEGSVSSVNRIAAQRLVQGECLMLDYRWDLVDALRACMRNDWDTAIELLSKWDRNLTETRHRHEWFETRLRLIAAHRLAGRSDRVERLAAPLREKATLANDWLTLRRLDRLLDAAEPATPVALLAPLSAGPFASTPAPMHPAAVNETTDEPAPSSTAPTSPDPSPLGVRLRGLFDRWLQLDADESSSPDSLIDETLAYGVDEVTNATDVARLLFLAGALANQASAGRAADLWQWGQTLAAKYPEDADTVGHLAFLAFALREASDEMAEKIPNAEVDQLFRKALRLDANNAGNFLRAGMYRHAQGDLGEAERCLARAFRLQRGSAFAALRLAEIYQQTDRPRDALAVLDICLRDGQDHHAVAWEAGMIALGLEQYDAALAYLDRVEELQPGDANTQYYRGVALLELGRAEDALAAIDEEEQRVADRTFHLELIRACATLDRGQMNEARQHLQAILQQPLREADYLTLSGFGQLFSRLWRRTAMLPAQDPLRRELSELLLACGMMPDEFFEQERQKAPQPQEVNAYRCLIRQPLGKNWPQASGCLSGQETWSEYFAEWIVLAGDEDDAANRALQWQGRCHPLPAEVEAVELASEGFFDKPGVVSQGPRWSPGA